MQKFNFWIVILTSLILINIGIVHVQKPANQRADSLTVINLSFVGDLMCHSPQFESAMLGKDSFDFKPLFNSIKPFLESADVTFGNLETVTAGKSKKYTGYPMFNSPDEYIEALKYAGFDVLFTSNNHSADRGDFGVLRTIDILKKNNIHPIGTFNSERDRDSIRIINVKGINLALLAYTYGLNGNVVSKKFYVNQIDTLLIKKDINRSRELKADVILVYFHFGNEYERKPSEYQKEIVSKAIHYGADLIIGSHPHVIQGASYFKGNGKLQTGFVAYSLGNFISNQRWRYSDAGVIINLRLRKDNIEGSIKVDNFNFTPTWVYKGTIDGKLQYHILPADTSLIRGDKNFLRNDDVAKLTQSYNDTKLQFHKVDTLKNFGNSKTKNK
ncbi:MAG: CapA family protein [Melioribacteraceae bacterium]|nr:CapA family protein [Melioribacteraceae bacterium]